MRRASLLGGESGGSRADADGCVMQSRAEGGRDLASVGSASRTGSSESLVGETAGVGSVRSLPAYE
jgi:hypothetical protein